LRGTWVYPRRVISGWGGATHCNAIINDYADKPVVLGADSRTDCLWPKACLKVCTRSSLCAWAGLKKATSNFSGFYLDAGKQLVDPPAGPARRIEFYGDSIIEGSLMSDQPFSNGYLAYPQAAVSVCQSKLRRRANGFPTHRERDGRHLFTLASNCSRLT